MNGGTAFPSHGSMGEVAYGGMTMLEYFAAASLMGIRASGQGLTPEEASELARFDALALLKELGK